MDYEKKYNEALNWMRELYPGLHGATKEDAEHYFPELADSEDERIRKWIIEELKITRDSTSGKNPYSDDPDIVARLKRLDEAIDYLEKQKEQEPVVTHGETYHVDTLGTQQVIAGKMQQKPAWSEEDEVLRVRTINRLETLNYHGITGKEIRESIDWLKSLRPQPKQKWSGKDWNMLCDICGYISGSGSSSGITKEERTDWLHKLPKRFELQPSWKPSEEQMRALNKVVNGEVLLTTQHESLESLYEQLKKL